MAIPYEAYPFECFSVRAQNWHRERPPRVERAPPGLGHSRENGNLLTSKKITACAGTTTEGPCQTPRPELSRA